MPFDVIPAIDLKDGQCVRLKQGRMQDATVYHSNPIVVAEKWLAAGARRLHIVDLDGAFAGESVNAETIYQICQKYPELSIQVGGGIRNLDTLKGYFEAGVDYGILGTSAIKNPEFVIQMSKLYPRKIILGLDAKNGKVALEGWDEMSTIEARDLVEQFAEYDLASVIYTDINRDGMLQGVNVAATSELAKHSPFPIIASGGVKTIEDVKRLLIAHENIHGVIAGRALYTGDLILSQVTSLTKK